MPVDRSIAAVLAAASDAGDEGISANEAAEAVAEGKPSSNDRSAAGRALRALTTAGHLAPTQNGGKGTRFRLTDTGEQEVVRVGPPAPREAPATPAGKHPGPIVDKLPPPPENVPADVVREHAAARGRKRATFVELTDEQVAVMTPEERLRYRRYVVENTEDDPYRWLPEMFPSTCLAPFAPHHHDLIDYAWEIELGEWKPAQIDVWNRGGAKSSIVEMVVAALGMRGKRKYCWYVSGTKELAAQHVDSIATLLTSEMVGVAYPAFADRAVSEVSGASKGWSSKRLYTKAGFIVDAVGLDTAARGKRVDEQRPDLIILDDIDDSDDTPLTVKKKLRALSRKIIPAGSQDVIVIGVQNKIHGNSIFARLLSNGQPGEPEPADFLHRRTLSGPIPALYNLEIRPRPDEEGGGWEIAAGEPSWPEGFPVESCQALLDNIGLGSFMAEAQHEEEDLTGNIFDHLDFTNDGPIRVSEAACPPWLFSTVWVDPAISSTDRSDSMGIVADSVGYDPNVRRPRVYRRWAWEKVTSPDDALRVAFTQAVQMGAEVVGVETDQGGDTWESIYWTVVQREVAKIREDPEQGEAGQLPDGFVIPKFEWRKAGQTGKSKVERAMQMRVDYDLADIKHVEAQCVALERGLRRFPVYKPFDVVDAGYWSWKFCKEWIAERGGLPSSPHDHFQARAPRGAISDVSAANI